MMLLRRSLSEKGSVSSTMVGRRPWRGKWRGRRRRCSWVWRAETLKRVAVVSAAIVAGVELLGFFPHCTKVHKQALG